MSKSNVENTNNDKVSHHSVIAKVFHWGFAIAFIYGIAKQVDNIGQLEDFALLRFEVIFALGWLILLAMRYVYMSKTEGPELPGDTSQFQIIAAKVVHLGMYISFAAVAITGLLIGLVFWMGLKSGILVGAILGLHDISVNVTYLLVIIHIIAAVLHRFKRNGVWDSMVPVWKETKESQSSTKD